MKMEPTGREADLVKVQVTVSDRVVVEVSNHGPRPIRDIVLSEVRHVEHPEWAWRAAPSVARNLSAWPAIGPGKSVRCQVELLDGDEVMSPGADASVYAVRAFWSDLAGEWWVLTSDGLKALGHGTEAGDAAEAATVPAAARAAAEELPRLNSAEDAELRQLTWFARIGQLSAESQARLAELKARDRRTEVRDPRPDPTSRLADLSGPRIEPAAASSARCPNCGFEAHGASLPSACPACGQRMAATPAS